MAAAQLQRRLERLYGSEHVTEILAQIDSLAADHLRRRQPRRRAGLWDERDAILIAYGDSVQAPGERPLVTLADFRQRRLGDAFSVLHVLPFFPYCSDDGFSVIDYRLVNPELGDWSDIARLAEQGDLMVDLILNHASRESLWFADYRANIYPGRDYFIDMDPATNLSMVVRPRSTPLLTDVYTRRGRRFVWATFGWTQIDLNFRNPHVLLELIDILLQYARSGARVIRLDAVAYLWKEPGTSCIHLWQTHEVVKLFRDLLSAVEPECLLLTETNVPHAENVGYFGDGDEAHAVYQFSLPPLLLHALHTGSSRYLSSWARNLAPPPPGCTFVNFTASHDGVGLRPLEGLVPGEEQQVLLQGMKQRGGYVSTRRNPDGSDTPYELNISYFEALGDPSLATDSLHVPRFLLSQLVPMTLQGIPAVYLHSLTATPNDREGVERTGRTRSINRRKWDQAELDRLLDNPHSPAGQVFPRYLELLRLRRTQPALHPDASQQVLDLGDETFGVLRRRGSNGPALLALHNFTPFPQEARLPEAMLPSHSQIEDALCGEVLDLGAGVVPLEPYQARWLLLA